MYKINAILVENKRSVILAAADFPTDNHVRQLSLFLYGTLWGSLKGSSIIDHYIN
jgi:hypothetical protein